MGCCQASNHASSLEKYNKNGANKGPRVLLLGIGGSGKSTCLRQLCSMYETLESKFDNEEDKAYIPHIYDQILTSMKRLIDSTDTKYSPIRNEPLLEDLEFKDAVQESIDFIQTLPYIIEMTQEIQQHFQTLWNDDTIQQLFDYRAKLSVTDSTEYFMNDLERICANDYIPNETDILQLHWPTTAILETKLKMHDLTVTIVDVGGLRNERKKWYYCLENTNTIVYLVSLSSYNETLLEDHTRNALIEALELFDMQINSPIFDSFEFIIFFNKVDLFKEKLEEQNIPLTTAFENYTGDGRVESATDFVKEQFLSKNPNPSRDLHTHVTTMIDRSSADPALSIIKNLLEKPTSGTMVME